ncbi:MAG: GDSL-type esterase/lipase family protein [Bacteroidales bacterium]|nr:GDSL-type esterase/lipase family protein [Bacteroidales bacterium]
MKTSRLAITALAVACLFAVSTNADAKRKHWVATWATAEQVAEPHNCPPAPGLAGNSLRQIVQISIPGKTARIRLSNEFGEEPVEINAAEAALALTAGSSYETEPGSSRSLTFNGSPSIVINPGEYVVSDEFSLKMKARSNVAITLHFGSISASPLTSHPGSRTTSYLAQGRTEDFSSAVTFAHWYIINDIEVLAPRRAGAIVVLGDSITDGRGTTTDGQDRWTDILSRKLLADKKTKWLSVLNMGLGGNAVLFGGLGLPARQRYERDLFGQEGVKYIILFEGVNDIGGSRNPVEKAEAIIEVYKKIATEAHARDIKVFGATVTPFGKSFYDTGIQLEGWKVLNDWIRKNDILDGYFDFAEVMASPSDSTMLNEDFLFENDRLHSNAAGYRHLGNSIDTGKFIDKKDETSLD